MKLKQMTKALTAIGMVSSVFAVLPSYAQDGTEKIQKVEITGSSIKRTSIETAGSLQVLTRQDIERSGATTALGILTDTVAVSTDINSSNSSSGSFATGSSAAGMRGLGKVATLILVNGRRIAAYGLSDGAQEKFTNLDAIAADAIERIEILKDGASAIYGSDAIAGVINIILRKDFKGAQIKAGYRSSDAFTDLRSRNASAIFGFGDIETNGFNTYVTVEGYKRDGYTTGDLQDQYPAWHRASPGRSSWDAKSTFSPTGNYFLSSTNIVAAPGCPAENIDPADKLCKFDVLGYTGLTTNNERYALASNTHFKIGKDINANFELTYAAAYNAYIVAPLNVSNGSTTTSSSVWYNVNAGKMVGPFSYPKLPVGHPSNPYAFPVEYRARLMDTGNGFNFNKTNSDQYRAMLTLDGTVGRFDWKAAAGHMDSSADKATRAVSAKGYTDAIINKTYKFGQQNDVALLDAMFPIRTTKGKSTTTFIDGTMTGEVYQLPAGPVSVALGTDIRREAYEMKSSDNVLNGELVGVFGLQVKDTRNQYAVFGEATIPVIKRVELSAALRADKSDGFDTHLSPKLGLRVTPTDSLLLRATMSGGFRAPNIVESGNGLGRSSVSTSVIDPRRCPIANDLNALVQGSKSATTSDKALANSYRGSDCLGSLPGFVASNPDLKPETSRSLTLGAVFAPTKTLSFAIDYYNIERKDEIGTRTTVDILKGEATLPAGQLIRVDNSATDAEFLALVKKYAPATTVNYGNIGKLGLVYNPYVNSGKTRVSGFDFDVTSRFKIANLGDLRVGLQGDYVLNFQQFSVADNAWDINERGIYDGGSRMNAKLLASLKSGDWDNAVNVDYASSYSTNSISSPTYCVTQKVAPENMATCARVAKSFVTNWSLTYSGIKHTKINLFVGNVFQKSAPIKWRDGWAPQFRTYNVNATYNF
jgi:iron complex outermembrane receptor protein